MLYAYGGSGPAPIDGPGHDHSEAPTRGILAKRIEGWSVLSRLCSAYTFVAIELDNLPTHTFGDLAKFAFLVLGGLMVSNSGPLQSSRV